MSNAEPTLPRENAALLEMQLQRLAGHLLFVSSDRAFLEPLARGLVGDAVEDAAALRARLGEEDHRLEQQLAALGPTSYLAQLIAHHHLSRLESDLLFFALLPELDDRFGDVFQALRGPGSSRRPTLGIALRALLGERADRWQARRHLTGSPLWEAGLLRRDTEDRVGLDVVLIPSAPCIAAAHGHLPHRLDGGVDVERVLLEGPEQPLRQGLTTVADDLAGWIELVQIGAAHLICENLDDARAIASRLARSFARPLVRVSGVGAPSDAAVREAALVAVVTSGMLLVEVDRGVDVVRIPDGWRPPSPAFFASAPRCDVHWPASLPTRRIQVQRARPGEQAGIWQSALDRVKGTADVALFASRTHLTVSEIGRTASLAAERAVSSKRATPEHNDFVEALREAVPDPVSPVARSTRPRVAWSRLVLERETKARLEELVGRVQHRRTVEDDWGMAGAEGRGDGLIALFHGESGTGKTLGAEAVAARLGLPMMRVDLSRVVSKYIGETEKHLGALFDAAEGFRAVLFFDEADALFGNRTGVKDAHDRYANLETNYLLFRLEAFEGAALLATNLLTNIDTAFTRRLQFIVHFPRPSAALQRLIWVHHLPAEQLAADVDLDALVRRQDLVGGEIRNAALAAAYATAAAGGKIQQATLEHAVRAERIKRGKAVRRE